MKKFYQLISAISVKLIVLQIKIEKIRVVPKRPWEIENIFTFDLVFTNMEICQRSVLFEQLHKIQEAS